MTNIFCTNNQPWYANPLLVTGEYKLVHTHQEADVILFTGGEDVSPFYYGEPIGKYTHNSEYRDLVEISLFKYAKANNIPMVGVCRGSQLLCVCAGGKLVQHITGHGRTHTMETIDGRSFSVSSTHHQMQLPPTGAILMGWSEEQQSSCYLDGNNNNLIITTEVEAVYYPNINAFCVQYHPEIMKEDDAGVKYFQEQVANLVKGELYEAHI